MGRRLRERPRAGRDALACAPGPEPDDHHHADRRGTLLVATPAVAAVLPSVTQVTEEETAVLTVFTVLPDDRTGRRPTA